MVGNTGQIKIKPQVAKVRQEQGRSGRGQLGRVELDSDGKGADDLRLRWLAWKRNKRSKESWLNANEHGK